MWKLKKKKKKKKNEVIKKSTISLRLIYLIDNAARCTVIDSIIRDMGVERRSLKPRPDISRLLSRRHRFVSGIYELREPEPRWLGPFRV